MSANGTPERCIASDCAFPLFVGEEKKAEGRMDTARGPMHFGCYWKLIREFARRETTERSAA